MSYLGATDITLLLPQGVTVGASTTPLTLTEVDTIVNETGAYVDGYLAAQGHTVPVPSTATAGYAMVQRIVRDGAAAYVLDTLLPNVGGPGGRGPGDKYQKAYDDALKAIRNGDMVIVGLGDDPGEDSRALPRSFTTSHPADDITRSGIQTGASAMVAIDWQP